MMTLSLTSWAARVWFWTGPSCARLPTHVRPRNLIFCLFYSGFLGSFPYKVNNVAHHLRGITSVAFQSCAWLWQWRPLTGYTSGLVLHRGSNGRPRKFFEGQRFLSPTFYIPHSSQTAIVCADHSLSECRPHVTIILLLYSLV